MQQETVSLVICRCGWLSVASCYGVSVEMFNEHKDEETDASRSHDPYTVLGVSAPMDAEIVRHFKHQAHVLAVESLAIDSHKRWVGSTFGAAANRGPRRYSMGDVNHGLFRGLKNLLKITALAAGCVYGLWLLR